MESKDSLIVETKLISVIFNDCSKKCEGTMVSVDDPRSSQGTQTAPLCPVS